MDNENTMAAENQPQANDRQAETQSPATDALEQPPVAATEAVITPDAPPIEASAGTPNEAGPVDIKDLKPGMRLMGKVKNMVDFGAFIDIGVGRDGLAHISTLKRAGVDKTLKVGDEVEVQVRRADLDNNRISLTIPGAGRTDKTRLEDLVAGTMVTGRVVRLVDFGAFIDVDAQTDGLVHISQLSDGFVGQVSDVLEVGQEVEVRILDVDVERRRISLTIKPEGEARPQPQYADRPEPPMADERPRRGSFGGERVGGERAGGERSGGERAGGGRSGGERSGRGDRSSRYDDDRPSREHRDSGRGRRREPQVMSTDQEASEPGSTGLMADAWEKALRDRHGKSRS